MIIIIINSEAKQTVNSVLCDRQEGRSAEGRNFRSVSSCPENLFLAENV